MSVEDLPQGDLALLDHPVARELLASSIPARLGYIALDGTPRVTPIWSSWNGAEFIFGATGNSPKVRALTENPAVAVTIDSETTPYKILMVRGRSEVEVVEGAVEEYAEAAVRYMGPQHGASFRDHVKANFTGMARITVTPDWVGVIDFQTRFPSTY